LTPVRAALRSPRALHAAMPSVTDANVSRRTAAAHTVQGSWSGGASTVQPTVRACLSLAARSSPIAGGPTSTDSSEASVAASALLRAPDPDAPGSGLDEFRAPRLSAGTRLLRRGNAAMRKCPLLCASLLVLVLGDSVASGLRHGRLAPEAAVSGRPDAHPRRGRGRQPGPDDRALCWTAGQLTAALHGAATSSAT
jgi:hypothetical protein